MKNVILLLAILAAACSSSSSPAPARSAQSGPARIGYTAADVAFMQGMIGHHAQALEMTALIAGRTTRREIQLLGERVTVSQHDEIARMKRWLESRKESLPADDAHVHAAMGHGELMPGMLTQEDLNKLSAARGDAFDQLFLEYMIRHHQGAIDMVNRLKAAGGGQEAEAYLFATDVEADQSAEIKRMRTLLGR